MKGEGQLPVVISKSNPTIIDFEMAGYIMISEGTRKKMEEMSKVLMEEEVKKVGKA